MAKTKPDKIREETYDDIVKGMMSMGREPIGRSKEGLVFENHLDGEHVVVKVIKKKSPVKDLEPIFSYKEQIKEYEDKKNEK